MPSPPSTRPTTRCDPPLDAPASGAGAASEDDAAGGPDEDAGAADVRGASAGAISSPGTVTVALDPSWATSTVDAHALWPGAATSIACPPGASGNAVPP